MLKLPRTASAIALLLAGYLAVSAAGEASPPTQHRPPACDPDDGGLSLPDGFCALVVAEGVGRARHLVVAPNGDIFVALSRSRRGDSPIGVLALRDTDGDGKADEQVRFGGLGGTGIALHDGYLYFGPDDRILRYPLPAGSLAPSGAAETVVSGLPGDRSHRAKSIAITPDGILYVNVGAPTNTCQEQDRAAGSPGQDPCPQLENRAGIWRFDADAIGQTQADGERFATGLRNVVALALHPTRLSLYGVQHGRDQLSANWPDLFTNEQSAEKPSEELLEIERGDDFGWPYCYHDPDLNALMLAPEYGGDGRTAGRCSQKKGPLMAFPAHWGPNALLFYTGSQFPERYRDGAFIAFHGSWNRAPLPQGGYNVVFVPFEGDAPAGRYEIFADGFAGADKDPRRAAHRPAGLAQGPDGSLYISDDSGGRIWRIIYTGS